ncbi:MAG: 1,4-alpha-glucan branching protein domain-containing protein [Gemmatimonadota bacterium]
MNFVLMLHSHLPYVLNHGRWPHGSDWICEAAIETYLPLLAKLQALDTAGIAAPVTIGFTPVLANQLEHPTFAEELEAYFKHRFEFLDEAPASLQSTNDSHLLPLVGYWRDRLERMRSLFRSLDGRILDGFRALQDRERIEITSSAATHGFLPLLGRDESIRLQLALGFAEHRRIFGRDPVGCWVPECAYRPAGKWQPLPNVAPRQRLGIEHFVAEAGFRYFYVDAHLARAGQPLGVYAQLVQGEPERMATLMRSARHTSRTPYSAYRVTTHNAPAPVDVLVRDPRSSAQVWNRHGGYPGYGAYLEFHKIRWPGGVRLWRVTGQGVDLGAKEPYDPAAARWQAHEHAKHFAALLDGIAQRRHEHHGDVIVAPFDTELFGHWWYEGPDFLGDVYANLPNYPSLHATRGADHVKRTDVFPVLRLGTGSWGRDGDWSMWLGQQTWWTWPVIWELEEWFWSLAPRAIGNPTLHAVLAQAARAMLLVQSSDWQFIISTGEVDDYAIKRFNGHVADCKQLLQALGRALEGEGVHDAFQIAAAQQQRDDVFPDIIPSIETALIGATLAARV